MKRTAKYILAGILLLFLFFIVTSCTKTVYVPVDNVKIIKETVTVHDTVVEIELVPYYKETTTEKDSSYLENEYAYSSARWDGTFLHHNLGISDKKIPVNIQYKDRFIYITDSISVPYPIKQVVEVNRLSPFQSFQIWCGRLFLLFILGWLALALIKRYR